MNASERKRIYELKGDDMLKRKFTKEECSAGGKKVMSQSTDAVCEHCGKSDFKNHAAYIGHLGHHSLADRHFHGDVDAALDGLARMGQASCDPAPWNGAFAHGHNLLRQVRGADK